MKKEKGERRKEKVLSGIKHEAAIEPSAQALHHKTVFQFCNHHL
jgi:hypothetical protein